MAERSTAETRASDEHPGDRRGPARLSAAGGAEPPRRRVRRRTGVLGWGARGNRAARGPPRHLARIAGGSGPVAARSCPASGRPAVAFKHGSSGRCVREASASRAPRAARGRRRYLAERPPPSVTNEALAQSLAPRRDHRAVDACRRGRPGRTRLGEGARIAHYGRALELIPRGRPAPSPGAPAAGGDGSGDHAHRRGQRAATHRLALTLRAASASSRAPVLLRRPAAEIRLRGDGRAADRGQRSSRAATHSVVWWTRPAAASAEPRLSARPATTTSTA